MSELKMPERQEGDGECGVSSPEVGVITITATQNGKTTTVVMSEYNAWRAFGMLSVLLGIPLPKKIAKAITLGDKPTEVSFESKAKTFGDRVAEHLFMQELADRTGGELVKVPGQKKRES